ncbi:glycine cleavage system protein GcvH [Streptomyces antibioticus]|uniref:glycine cleavage system protein GcvH n=1 Tax=Streptomyces antibioticus TaxID=1890 RepID=UPI00225C0EE9|nr:glycine cleavage system protein GcvH [Streptomyces antibioticus]MCX4743869.1 glycine cleavage system protein GcvH [Streptomyces antibioticus]MCX5166868.1 glycine cleavage system protein GcvH [Streptomyces antibioticus]
MANVPTELKYTKDHEWVQQTGADVVRVGITEFAQRQLGDVVFVELPDKGRVLEAGDPFASIESVKAVSEVYAPLSGTVSACNDELDANAELVNDEPYGEGWLIDIKIDDKRRLDGLLTAAEYEELVREAE